MKKIWLGLVLLTPVCLLSQNRYDVVIDEIMADPSPAVGLPNSEWIELKNTSAGPVNLQNWRLGDGSGISGPLPNYILLPDSFVIVCTGSASAALSAFGRVVSVTGFPSLDNEGDLLYLRAANGSTIHAVQYNNTWYKNELKKDGGWTLEMADPRQPCMEEDNWKASTDLTGGTPGKRNASYTTLTSNKPPVLIRSYTTDSITIILLFSGPVDSLSGASPGNYSIDGGMSWRNAVTQPPLFNTVKLTTTTPLQPNTIYHISVVGVHDCKGNRSGPAGPVSTGLATNPGSGEWVINEILFNPRSGAYDFTEFLNNSNRILDASRLYIASRNSSGQISSVKPLCTSPFLVFPGDHIAVTEEPGNLALQYLVKDPGHILTLPALPSFPDDEGWVLALDAAGFVLDEVHYRDDWHFKLIADPEGISLERIDPIAATQDPGNWHSAATTAGYATPGYRNSQFKRPVPIDAKLELSPRVFSPDNDGRDDIATLQYTVSEPGYVANIIIFDAAGRPVRYLVRQALLGLQGYWNWDGLNEKGARLPVGPYIFYTEIFDLRGRISRYRPVLTLARH